MLKTWFFLRQLALHRTGTVIKCDKITSRIPAALTLWRRSSSKYLNIQSVPQREHDPYPQLNRLMLSKEIVAVYSENHKVKLSRYRHLGDEGRGVIAPTHPWPRHYMGWVVSVTPWPRFTPKERTSGTHWIGGWVGLIAGLDTETREKILCPCRRSNPGRPVCSQTLYWLSYPRSYSENHKKLMSKYILWVKCLWLYLKQVVRIVTTRL
jgi:hypothetical protein